MRLIILLACLPIVWSELIFDINRDPQVSSIESTDDGLTFLAVQPEHTFPFYGENVTRFYVSLNGLISFNNPTPVSNWNQSINMVDSSFIAPLWINNDNEFIGKVYQRQSQDTEELETANKLVEQHRNMSNFNGKSIFLVEWENVAPCNMGHLSRNRFQSALLTDGCASYAILSYQTVAWGSEDGIKVAVVHQGDVVNDVRTAQQLENSYNIFNLGGENPCTGHKENDHVAVATDITRKNYFVCGYCSPVEIKECPGNEVFDALCGGCANGTYPNCDGQVHGNWSEWIKESECIGDCGIGIYYEFRICNNPRPSGGGRPCEGDSLREVNCTLSPCKVDGKWSSWSSSACSVSCGEGVLNRTRNCTNPKPENGGADCVGNSSKVESCFPRRCPVDGKYGAWENVGNCSQSCGDGGQLQRRYCDSPSPQNGGQNCSGNATRTVPCFIKNCAVNGNWSSWIEAGSCSASCGGGVIAEYRLCDNPEPNFGGKYCEGAAERVSKACNTHSCPDICTAQDAADNGFVYDPLDPSYYCICMRTSDNSASFIHQCYVCAQGTTYDTELNACSAKVSLSCKPDAFCVDKTPNRNYSINHGQTNAKCSNLYYFCDANLQQTRRSCGMTTDGVYFDPTVGACVHGNPPAEECQNSYCVGRSNGNYDRVDDFCKTYRQCNAFTMSIQTCNGFYDVNTKSCVNTANPPDASCIHPLCNNKDDGIYVQDNTCTGYYQCLNNRRVSVVDCPNEQYFNGVSCQQEYPGNQCQHNFCRDPSRNGIAGNFALQENSCGVDYIECSGSLTSPPNQASFSRCPNNQYFSIVNNQNWLGGCQDSPPANTCPNYRCIGRADGFKVEFDGNHNCQNYYECQSQEVTIVTCPNETPYFNGVQCTAEFDEVKCQHPDCLTVTVPASFPITSGNECSTSYYQCDVNSYRSVQACQPAIQGSYFGRLDGTFQCRSGNVASTCGEFPDYVCVGKITTENNTPLYKDPTDNYCQKYIKCLSAGAAVDQCPGNGYFNPDKEECVAQILPGCWRDGGVSLWSEWQYVEGSQCSSTCGSDASQIQQRIRSCTNPTPLEGGNACAEELVETRQASCEVTPPECGDSFCHGKPAGSYSKSLLYVPPVNKACFKDYYKCSGPPGNILTTDSCQNADYVFVPDEGCKRANIDPTCPVNECSRKEDGLYPISNNAHDCRNYISCTNEFKTSVSCPITNNRPTYFDPVTKICVETPGSNCNPVFGFWSSWVNDGNFCTILNGECRQRQTRTCSDPIPINDPNACPGDVEQFIACNSCSNPCVTNPCVGTNALCQFTPSEGSGYICTCPTGYNRIGSGNTLACQDINECNGEFPCHQNAVCLNTPGSYTCTCKQYFRGNGRQCTDINECTESLHDCHANAQCTNVVGQPGFTCQCRAGFTGNGVQCQDVNECLSPNGCHSNAACTNNIGSYTCQCRNGYRGNGFSCEDINECQEESDSCHINALCVNTIGSYVCQCNQGYAGNGFTCTDINECTAGTANCHQQATCTNNIGGYVCSCRNGYAGDGFFCADINECSLPQNNICNINADCTNSIGSYSCSCKTGYSGDGVDCFETNECIAGTDNCHTNADCTNTIGSFTCSCKNGYQGDGVTCTAINACATNNCHSNARCEELQDGNFRCVCNAGYTGNGISCQDINECLSASLNDCHENANCFNQEGTYICACKQFYQGDGRTCIDTNECALNIDSCHENANCFNQIGAAPICQCKAGWTGNGLNCVDLNECLRSQDNNCHVNAVCTNLIGTGFSCQCRVGYAGNGVTCTDVNECNAGTDNCHINANCFNTIGSYQCACKQGFNGDGVNNCIDFNECQVQNGGCDGNADCTNTIGSRLCNCRLGFTGDGLTCTDRNECTLQIDNCHQDAICTNTIGSFDCTCRTGFTGNGLQCVDINECLSTELNNCHINADCTNIPGGFTCACKENFQGDGVTCTASQSCSDNPCHEFASCQDLEGSSFNCICILGYTGNGFQCENVNECTSGQAVCDVNAQCTDTIGSYTCQCNLGYLPNGNACIDINECLTNAHDCNQNAQCTNIPGSYSCQCNQGYQGDGVTCTAVNACDNNNCHSNAQCNPLPQGSFQCVCNLGYTGNGVQCLDVNECTAGTHDCHAEYGVCTNTIGSFTCQCQTGFTGDGKQCTDIDECLFSTTNNCHDNANCINTPGLYRCECKSGFVGNGVTCAATERSCQFNGDRYENQDDPTGNSFFECQGLNPIQKTCPTAELYAFDDILGFISFPNGMVFSSYFRTCVNTTNQLPPPTVTAIERACDFISNNHITNDGIKLPYNNDSNCKACDCWLVCKDQRLDDEVNPFAGDCQTNLKYDADLHYCDSVVTCPFN